MNASSENATYKAKTGTLNLSTWPDRAIVTAGMPYGNKPLHFGHIAGVFVPADCFARFLRDRIGAQNVRFISGTDCYGSPINEGFRKLCEAGEFSGTISEYVENHHKLQKEALSAYAISLDIYEGSGIGSCGKCHQEFSNTIIEKLYKNGWLLRRSTLQFYDTKAKTFLNGRQVHGHCPVQGCKSQHAYADECDLGHSFAPQDLINPVSSLTETVPEMRPVENWYFDLPAFTNFLRKHVSQLEADEHIRKVVPQVIKEFLAPPVVFIKNELLESYKKVAAKLPAHTFHEAEGNKQSFSIEFENIDARDAAREVLEAAGIRFRTGKALVPFRITGNIDWGVKAPVIEGLEGLTVWCWPESLWAPISFTQALSNAQGTEGEAWQDFWCSENSKVYQFIGQDNLYFYGVAQPAIFEALKTPSSNASNANAEQHPIRQTMLVANHHILFGKTKASSSGSVKPPTALELLEHYTPEQLRAHFLALGLDQKSVGFKPKVFDPDETKRNNKRYADPVLKEGALLTNVFNRLARSCFYEAQKNFDCNMPLISISPAVLKQAHEALNNYDATMQSVALHKIMSLMDAFIRQANKYWTDNIRTAQNNDDSTLRKQTLADSFYLLRVATLLMHPIVPAGCEKICNMLNFSSDEFFSWDYTFDSMAELCTQAEVQAQAHKVAELPPRTDFFKKHPSQY